MFKKILVPIDGVTPCNKCIDYVKEIASHFNSEIVLFNAQEIIPTIAWVNDPVAYTQPSIDPEKIATEILNRALQCFEGSQLNITVKYLIGDAAHSILDVCTEFDCDAIVMNTHANTAIKRFLLGSVTDKVVHHAKVTVVIVR